MTYILFFLQAIVGVAQLYVPALFGGEENAKKVYKYHRMSGYLIVLMTLVTICAATQTSFNVNAYVFRPPFLNLCFSFFLGGFFLGGVTGADQGGFVVVFTSSCGL